MPLSHLRRVSDEPRVPSPLKVTIWIAVCALLVGGIVYLARVYPVGIWVNRLALLTILTLSAFVHTLAAIWCAQVARRQPLAQPVGSANAVLAVVEVIALWVIWQR